MRYGTESKNIVFEEAWKEARVAECVLVIESSDKQPSFVQQRIKIEDPRNLNG
ncbi:hypothetical protein WN55_00123 [Dufourea novaeangliae]|uniref:Uncharacterized protein n=1 Tax=Dufourea novaeangliae TaxID=178035 RepID=A0A154NWH5_DUFNO|nr:hypothetical protein WN55_00123 [Dufourea novaeangliae]